MSIPKLNAEDIKKALEYINEKGVPEKNQSTKYELVLDDGKRYPPKYVIAVADYIKNDTELSTKGFNAVEAKNYLESHGYTIETNQQEEYKLFITADSMISTDERFTLDNLGLGDNYEPLDACFIDAEGNEIKRNRNKWEKRISNQTMPRIAFQIFESEIEKLTPEQKEQFPICKYSLNGDWLRGIYNSLEEFKKTRTENTRTYSEYKRGGNRGEFVIYCWNIFSTVYFVQECLKRFGKTEEQFVLTYREKTEKEIINEEAEENNQEELINQKREYRNPYSKILIESKNIILHGAPGTGKTFLAQEIATDIISDGYLEKYTSLSEEQKQQVEFVQFHPSYDYSDFVEGLRPKNRENDSLGFELKPGVFKRFLDRAIKNNDDSERKIEELEKAMTVQEELTEFFSNVNFGVDEFETITHNVFTISDVDEDAVNIYIPDNPIKKTTSISIKKLSKLLESENEFTKVKDVVDYFGTVKMQEHSYYYALYREIKSRKSTIIKGEAKSIKKKKYIFIIDEINRGDISKIFGELFFSIDPGYRGQAGAVSTQYSNMHIDQTDKLYIPDNVFIIGTMNDIDKSVDSFDFAMRRRFRFINIKADDRLEMLDEELEDDELKMEAIERMTMLNKEIAEVEELNENYQIGASYFLKLKHLNFDELWKDYLQPLLQEYVHGMYNETGIMQAFEKAYRLENKTSGETIESM